MSLPERAERRCFVSLQSPHDGTWLPVGLYKLDKAERGTFQYAVDYLESASPVSIDPINLPLRERGYAHLAHRYDGMHDVLRDACPDAWGQSILRREHGLPTNTHYFRYLMLADNRDRWGALKVGEHRKPNTAKANSPSIASLERLLEELDSMSRGEPPRHVDLRKRLVNTASLGGARPKTTVQDKEAFWLAKPRIGTDSADVPKLEHAAMQWAKRAGLNVADTEHKTVGAQSVLLVRRFDRHGDRRHMVLSGASMLECEYPEQRYANGKEGWSYPLLADALKRMGVPIEDRHELFGRMLFNALVGNDDDHPRNHAAIYRADEGRWRLAPAFDIVPNVVEDPVALAMQLAPGVWNIGRAAACQEWPRFGFASAHEAAAYVDRFVAVVEAESAHVMNVLPAGYDTTLVARMRRMSEALRGSVSASS